ncbi:unnamed protein product [Pelagomonas calceolata]|uniref:Phosphoacetylglucosamine mutase n=1 Tax=Pelagomonas calceolata TaxID=35677 RepID=A0A8J2SR41_9STRA|nr:unnamed protein product [Pelagomonas calceolata]
MGPALSKIDREHPPQLAYGTAGFRCDATQLVIAMERVGMLAALRSRDRDGLKIGVMVTASHNPHRDNGVKIVDPTGAMLAQAWESKAEKVACCPESQLLETLASVAEGEAASASVVIGRDTRAHSRALSQRVRAGAEALGARVEDVGVVTTPQLHHCVRAANGFSPVVKGPLYGYADALVDAFEALLKTSPHKTGRPDSTVVVDCAGGVGAFGIHQLRRRLEERGLASVLSLRAANIVREAPLNHQCGAEHVQKQRLPPKNLSRRDLGAPNLRGCSVDGDADRLVYWFHGLSNFEIVDGDKIASLLAVFIARELAAAQPLIGTPSLGVVQTAYANGAAAAFLRERRVEVAFAKTGVKYVHHAAEAFDVGVYFEANGHGTVLVKEALRARLAQLDSEPGTGGRARLAVSRLHAVARLANQSVGDALADLLLVEAVLCLQQKSIAAWGALYDELPSRQLKQRVASRALLEPNATETRLVAPAALQAKIDALAASHKSGRAFVRPSGTEDVVRVYAEAATRRDADALALEVRRAVFDLAGGLGERP